MNLLQSLDATKTKQSAGTDANSSGYDCVVGAVAHTQYSNFTPEQVLSLIHSRGICVDIKGMWHDYKFPPEIHFWSL